MKRTFALLILLSAALSWACSGDGDIESTAEPSGAFPLTITQTDGATITLQEPPARIVSLAASATEIICSLDAGDRLAAVEKFENCPSGSSANPAVDAFPPHLEAIAAFGPALVYTTYNPSGLVESLRRVNIPVVYLDVPKDIAGVYESIELFGKLTATETKAAEITAAMKARQDAVTGKLGSEQGPRIYHELDNTYFTVAPGSFVGDFYNLLRASNIAAGAASDYPQLSAEVIIERNPQVIVLADEQAGVTPASVKERPGWDVIDAVRNDRICSIDPDIVSRPGPRVIDALEDFAECLYPEKF